MTKKTTKFLSIIVVLSVAIIIALTVAIKIYITPEKVKAILVPEAEKALNRRVTLGEIHISLLKGIEVRDFTIKEEDDVEDFVKCESFVLKYKLLPLLSKKVILDELRLVSPAIRIERNTEGTYNFDNIGGKGKPQAADEEKEAAEPKGLPASLLVSKVIIKDAQFSFVDRMDELPDVNGAVNADLGIKSAQGNRIVSDGQIDLKLSEVLLKKPSEKKIRDIKTQLEYAVLYDLATHDIHIENADLKIQDIPLNISGHVKGIIEAKDLDITVSLQTVDTAKIQKLITHFVDMKRITLSGNVTADLKIKGNPKKMDSLKTEGTLQLEQLRANYEKIDLLADGNFILRPDEIIIETAELNFEGIPASVKGKVKDYMNDPFVDLSVSVVEVKTAEVQKSVAPLVDAKGLALSGNVTADLRLVGKPRKIDSMKTDGTIGLEGVGIAYNGVDAVLDGRMDFESRNVTFDLIGTIGKNAAQFRGSVDSYLKDRKVKLNIYSKELVLEEMIPAGKSASATPDKEPRPVKGGAPEEAKPLDLKLTADGEIRIDTARYKNMIMSDFYTTYLFKNNVLEITKMTAGAGKGKFNLNSTVDLSKAGYTYRLSGNIDSLDGREVVNSFFPKARDTVYGILSANLKLNGTGTLPESLKKNLVGDGDFSIKDGKITNSKLPEQLAVFLGIEELRTIQLKKANGRIKIRNGFAGLDSIFSSDDLSLDPSGVIGLDETLDLSFDLKMSPRLTDKALMTPTISSYIKDEKGWGIIPLKVSGTLSDPSYGIDIEKAGKRIIKKKGEEFIEKLFEKNERQKEEGTGREKEEIKPTDLLKELFK